MAHLYQLLMQQINQHQPSRLVLAYSGGLDSQVLLHLLAPLCQRLAIPLQAVHVHHGLSPHADAWAEFCALQCQQRQVAFVMRQVTLCGGNNLEQQARRARYAVLAEYVTAAETALVCAHHADDQLETCLLALKRGSGLAGLAAMPDKRAFAAGYLLRPLLSCSRAQLAAYAAAEQLQWVEDESNQNTDFDRNFIRHDITPRLQQRWPHFVHTATRTLQHVQQALTLAEHYTAEALARCLEQEKLNLQQLQQFHPLQQDLLLRRWLLDAGFNPDSQWLDTLKRQVIAARSDAVPLLVAGPWQVRRYQHYLYKLAPLPEFAAGVIGEMKLDVDYSLPDELGWLSWHAAALPGAQPVAIDNAPYQLALGTLSLLFKPAGQQSKPLKQWFKLWQVPPWQRGRVPLLIQDGTVKVVVGFASSFAPTDKVRWLSWQPVTNGAAYPLPLGD